MARKSAKTEELQQNLVSACTLGLKAKVEALMKIGVDPSFQNSICLQKALDGRFEQISRLLLKHGARASDVAPRVWAQVFANSRLQNIEYHYWKVTMLLSVLTKDTVPHELLFLSLSHTPILIALLSMGANPNCVRKDGASPLAAALLDSRLEAAHLLLDSGADPHFEYEIPHCHILWQLSGKVCTMLHLAASRPNLHPIVERLLKAGVRHTTSVCSPLAVALYNKARESVLLLAAAGAGAPSTFKSLMQAVLNAHQYYAIPELIMYGVLKLSTSDVEFLTLLRREPQLHEGIRVPCTWTASTYAVNHTALLQACRSLAPQKLL